MDNFRSLQWLALALSTVSVLSGALVAGCNVETREVGVCLHVYLERDFLTMERIVYPRRNAQRRDIQYNRYSGPGALRQLPNLTELNDATPEGSVGAAAGVLRRVGIPEGSVGSDAGVLRRYGRRQTLSVAEVAKDRHKDQLLKEEDGSWSRVGRSAPDNYAVIDAYGQHGWVEGPELEDYCSRLGTVITCFEDVLVDCDNGYDFFRYRHLLHSLDRVHTYLCRTANDRTSRFLPFLKLIECAERARVGEASCHRPNVTINVWNQILRLEVGPELCDSLNTQRSCLLENEYVLRECGGEAKEELYKNVSGVFLATWCRLPLHSHFFQYARASSLPSSAFSLVLPLLMFLLATLPSCW
ncbi:uncharacterized protein [Procambarus clarkii]|uniref:uncharacterized protein isoform X1 n=2 Tax=Procambarus clarkii TaxID=6728 RepID=UPI001E6740DA|nr:uncharacterized protein LOC123765108 [Procambarus clarkii]XP_045609535.1 uncharacterized protein LOC123765108 [Procambarus clarkii]